MSGLVILVFGTCSEGYRKRMADLFPVSSLHTDSDCNATFFFGLFSMKAPKAVVHKVGYLKGELQGSLAKKKGIIYFFVIPLLSNTMTA